MPEGLGGSDIGREPRPSTSGPRDAVLRSSTEADGTQGPRHLDSSWDPTVSPLRWDPTPISQHGLTSGRTPGMCHIFAESPGALGRSSTLTVCHVTVAGTPHWAQAPEGTGHNPRAGTVRGQGAKAGAQQTELEQEQVLLTQGRGYAPLARGPGARKRQVGGGQTWFIVTGKSPHS